MESMPRPPPRKPIKDSGKESLPPLDQGEEGKTAAGPFHSTCIELVVGKSPSNNHPKAKAHTILTKPVLGTSHWVPQNLGLSWDVPKVPATGYRK